MQADLRTFQRLGVFGASAITAVTAQNLSAVTAVDGVRATLVAAQMDAVLAGFPVAAIKTGMLWSAELVRTVTGRLEQSDAALVVDPVMVATSGARLLDEGAIAAYAALFRRAALVTPNLDEAAVLLGAPIDRDDLPSEARRLSHELGTAVLLKGGHLDGAPIDVLALHSDIHTWTHDRIHKANTHGSGCMLSAAIAALLAHGQPLVEACAGGLAFVHDALARGARVGHAGLADIENATIEPNALVYATEG